jgi:hypothetical protein
MIPQLEQSSQQACSLLRGGHVERHSDFVAVRRGEAPIFKPNSETGGHKLHFYPLKNTTERASGEAKPVTVAVLLQALDHSRLDFSHEVYHSITGKACVHWKLSF